MQFVDLKKNYEDLQPEIDTAIQEVISKTAFIGTDNNPFIVALEKDFANYLGVNHCVSCANGTDALEIALASFDIGQGDEVIVPAISWISTAEAVLNVGATPIFVDVNYTDCNINSALIEEAITKKTKAIIPVHIYGNPADMNTIVCICTKHQLTLIEDCAQAHGASIENKKIGTFGDAACFSFYPGKNLGAFGDAGAIIFKEKSIAMIAKQIRNHGQNKKHSHLRVGRNSRMDGIHAAVIAVKLKKLDQGNSLRIAAARHYDKLISSKIEKPGFSNTIKSVYHLYVIKVNNREELISKLDAENIPHGIHYPTALPNIPLFNDPKEYKAAEKACSKIISLPIHPYITQQEIEKIANIVNEFAF
jgi:dTDP-4-amino-4,6-dideoxygalactose transaminase